MACRRRRRLDSSGKRVPHNVDHLAFKYMEMCKVESSSDSESEASPRWSDTSTMGCVSSAAESECVVRAHPLMPKSGARHDCCSMFVDPYDGSSEDSDASMDVQCLRRTQQGPKSTCSLCTVRNRRVPHPFHQLPAPGLFKAVSMETHTASCGDYSSLDSALCSSDKDDATHSDAFPGEGLTLHREGTGLKSGWSHMTMDSSSERSPSPSYLHKRKFGLPGAELLELGQRKRQCVLNMEVDSEAELRPAHAQMNSRL